MFLHTYPYVDCKNVGAYCTLKFAYTAIMRIPSHLVLLRHLVKDSKSNYSCYVAPQLRWKLRKLTK